jgi:hypothetical protein
LRPFFFAANSRLQQTEHATAPATKAFLKRSAARRTRQKLLRARLHLFELKGKTRPRQRLPDLALNLFLSLGGHLELPNDEVFHKPARRLRREQTLPEQRPKQGDRFGQAVVTVLGPDDEQGLFLRAAASTRRLRQLALRV